LAESKVHAINAVTKQFPNLRPVALKKYFSDNVDLRITTFKAALENATEIHESLEIGVRLADALLQAINRFTGSPDSREIIPDLCDAVLKVLVSDKLEVKLLKNDEKRDFIFSLAESIHIFLNSFMYPNEFNLQSERGHGQPFKYQVLGTAKALERIVLWASGEGDVAEMYKEFFIKLMRCDIQTKQLSQVFGTVALERSTSTSGSGPEEIPMVSQHAPVEHVNAFINPSNLKALLKVLELMPKSKEAFDAYAYAATILCACYSIPLEETMQLGSRSILWHTTIEETFYLRVAFMLPKDMPKNNKRVQLDRLALKLNLLVTMLAATLSRQNGMELKFDATCSMLEKVSLSWSESDLNRLLDCLVKYGPCDDEPLVSVLASTLLVIVLEMEEIRISKSNNPDLPTHQKENLPWSSTIETNSDEILDLLCRLLKSKNLRVIHIGLVLSRLYLRHENRVLDARATGLIDDKATLAKLIPALITVPLSLADTVDVTPRPEPRQQLRIALNIPTEPHGWPGDKACVDWAIIDNFLMYKSDREDIVVNTMNLIRLLTRTGGYAKVIIKTEPGGERLLNYMESLLNKHASDTSLVHHALIDTGAECLASLFCRAFKQDGRLAVEKFRKTSAIDIFTKVSKRCADTDMTTLWRQGSNTECLEFLECLSHHGNILPLAFEPIILIKIVYSKLKALCTALQSNESTPSTEFENKEERDTNQNSRLSHGKIRVRSGFNESASPHSMISGARSALLNSLPPLLTEARHMGLIEKFVWELENSGLDGIESIAQTVVQCSSAAILEMLEKLWSLAPEEDLRTSRPTAYLVELYKVVVKVNNFVKGLREIIEALPDSSGTFMRAILGDSKAAMLADTLAKSVGRLCKVFFGASYLPRLIRTELSLYFEQVSWIPIPYFPLPTLALGRYSIPFKRICQSLSENGHFTYGCFFF
jgi:hypothetical protein